MSTDHDKLIALAAEYREACEACEALLYAPPAPYAPSGPVHAEWLRAAEEHSSSIARRDVARVALLDYARKA